MDPTLVEMIISFCIGVFSGTLAGLFGLGGASIAISLMNFFLGMDAHQIIGTALPLTIPAALTGAIVYQREGLLKYKTVITAGLAGAVTSVLGAFCTSYFPSQFLMGIFGILLLAFAFSEYKEKETEKWYHWVPLKEKAAKTVFIGAVAGFVSGFLGIGGGIVLVPLLINLRGIPYRKAVATSLAIIVVYAIPGSIAHFSLGNFDAPVFMGMFFGAIIGGWHGARVSRRWSEGALKRAFSLVLAAMGVLLLIKEIGLML